MPRFSGVITAKLDAKGRVFFPSAFRRQLQYAEDDRNQYLDCGASFDFSKPCKNAKANFLVSVMAKQHIGYKLEYKNLACKRWTKWVRASIAGTPARRCCFVSFWPTQRR